MSQCARFALRRSLFILFSMRVLAIDLGTKNIGTAISDGLGMTVRPVETIRGASTGAAIERSAAMTHWEHDGSVRRFQRIMQTLGVDVALREAGVEDGDTVAIGEFELEWQE